MSLFKKKTKEIIKFNKNIKYKFVIIKIYDKNIMQNYSLNRVLLISKTGNISFSVFAEKICSDSIAECARRANNINTF